MICFNNHGNTARFCRFLAIGHKTFNEPVISCEQISLKERHDLKVGVIEKDLNISMVGVHDFIPVFEDAKRVREVIREINESY